MQVQYHEFAASCEDEKTSRAAGGKTGYVYVQKVNPVGSLVGVKQSMAATVVSVVLALMEMPQKIKSEQLIFSHLQHQRISSMMFAGWGYSNEKVCSGNLEVKTARNRPTNMPNALTFDGL